VRYADSRIVCTHEGRKSRGLCVNRCWKRAKRLGTLDTYQTTPRGKPKGSHQFDWHIEEVEAGAVTSWSEAYRLGIKPSSLSRSLQRGGRTDLVIRLGGDHAARNSDAHVKQRATSRC
jgi:hypothetical protein